MAGVISGLAKGIFGVGSLSARGAAAYGEIAMDAGKGLLSAAKYPFQSGTALRQVAKAHPMRTAGVTAAAGLSVAAFGLAGAGPLGGIGEEYSRYATSRHGDRPETRRVIGAVQGWGTAIGVGLGAAAGFGAFGKGPLAWNYGKPAMAGLRGIGSAAKGAGRGIGSIASGAVDMAKGTPRFMMDMAGMQAYPRRPNSPGLRTKQFIGSMPGRARAGAQRAGNYASGYASGLFNTQSALPGAAAGRYPNKYNIPGGVGPPSPPKRYAKRTRNLANRAGTRTAYGQGRAAATSHKASVQAGVAAIPGAVGQGVTNAASSIKQMGSSVLASFGQKGDPWIIQHPIKAGLMFSAAGGAAAAVAESYVPEGYGGFEGEIMGISNSKPASVSPELQFSTNDLMFSLHNNNRSKRSRYQ